METRNVANLIFNTSLGKKRIVRIPDPVAHINPVMVNTSADQLINANPFDETIGSPLSLANAEQVITTRITLF